MNVYNNIMQQNFQCEKNVLTPYTFNIQSFDNFIHDHNVIYVIMRINKILFKIKIIIEIILKIELNELTQ